ncbi:MAG: hypothetical protein LBT40_05970, partial [Deltaproteobacteria bacterium]|nr:hypothetical protein [Deltaproteobacteria bacterium]
RGLRDVPEEGRRKGGSGKTGARSREGMAGMDARLRAAVHCSGRETAVKVPSLLLEESPVSLERYPPYIWIMRMLCS